MKDFKQNVKMKADGGHCYKKGGAVKKYNDGGVISEEAEEIIQGRRPPQATPGVMTPAERRASIAKAFGAGPRRPKTKAERDAEEMQELLGREFTVTAPAERRKKGGSVKRYKEGGALKAVDAQENPGLAKLPTPVRNKMGYAKKGGKVKK